jgi:hypothetical protein
VPGGLPLLLQHMELCHAGLRADCTFLSAPGLGTATAALADASSLAAAETADSGPAAASHAAGADVTGSSSAPGSMRQGVSQWADALADVLLTLRPWSSHAEVTDATATSIMHTSMLLVAHEVAVRQLLTLQGDETANEASIDRALVGIGASLHLRGPAAAMAQRSMLQHMASMLTAARHDVAQALPVPAATGAHDLLRLKLRLLTPATAARAPSAEESALPPQRAAESKSPEQAQQSPAAASRQRAVISSMDNRAYFVARLNHLCLGSEQLQFLVAPCSEGGQGWAAAIAAALAALLRYFGQDERGAAPREVLLTAFDAVTGLVTAAVPLLQHFLAAGLEALQQDAGLQLMHALAACMVSQPFTLPFQEVCTLFGIW